MAAKLILAGLLASFGVNGSPCKPSSYTFPSLATTSGQSIETSLVTGSTTLQSYEESPASTQHATSALTSDAPSSDLASSEFSVSQTDWETTSTSIVSQPISNDDSTTEQSIYTDTLTVTSWSSEPTTTSTIASTTVIAEEEDDIGFFNGGFEKDPSPNALPWVLGRGVTVPIDPGNARSGDRYALLRFPSTGSGPLYPLRQIITGHGETKTLLWTIYWAFTDFGTLSNTECDFQSYFGVLTDITKFKADGVPMNQYFKRQFLVTRSSVVNTIDLRLYWRCTALTPSLPWEGAEVRIDDVSLVEYDPPCTPIESPPQSLVCGQTGGLPGSAKSYLIGSELPWGPFENCAQMCAGNPECKAFSGSGGSSNLAGRNARCNLYSATPEQLGFWSGGGTFVVYQPGCFECRP